MPASRLALIACVALGAGGCMFIDDFTPFTEGQPDAGASLDAAPLADAAEPDGGSDGGQERGPCPETPCAAGYVCAADGVCVEAGCGNGVLEEPEACDDGDMLDDDYCAADCSSVAGRCGDGIVQRIEACDEGTVRDTSSCRAACTVLAGDCGNGVVDEGEACDIALYASYPEPERVDGLCHQCTDGAECLGTRGCGSTDARSWIGFPATYTASRSCTSEHAGALAFGIVFDTLLSGPHRYVRGQLALDCRQFDGEGVGVDAGTTAWVESATPASHPTLGCSGYPAERLRHTIRCDEGQVMVGMRGYELAAGDQWSTLGFVVPLCAGYAQARDATRIAGAIEPSTELVAGDTPHDLAERLAGYEANLESPRGEHAVRRVDFHCPAGHAIGGLEATYGCFWGGIRPLCTPIP